MGVGVFEDDFNGTGHTFIVSPPSDDYDSYVESMADDEDGALSEDEFYQDEYDNTIENIVSCISSMGEEIGFDVNEGVLRYARNSNKFVMDDVFTSIIENKYVQVGFRNWETDVIIGVAAANVEFENIPENYPLLDEYSIPLKQLDNHYEALSQSVYRYAILTLQENGHECRCKTSGYTTGLIILGNEEEIDKEKETLKVEILALIAKLDKTNSLSDSLNNPELREDFIKDIYKYNEEYGDVGIKLRIPYINLDDNQIVFVNPVENEVVSAMIMDDDVKAYFFKEGFVDGFYEIPLNDETKEFFTKNQAKEDKLFLERVIKSEIGIVDANEYRKLDPDFVFSSEDDELSLK